MPAKLIKSVGKRKVAIARAVLKPGTGKVRVNSKPLDLWGSKYLVSKIKEPLVIAEDFAKKVDINVVVKSSGVSSQADAIRTAIAKALAEFGGEELKKSFIEYDRTLIVPDMRQNEPWKPGASKPRASAQKSKR
ncbi:MAG: 30S ribosomal protein S9 [Candidatus Altiarchaeota archaeon]|nr:30S ribosomal protein S9 [Candidatus Altiarchaeota archaeon]